MALEDCFSNIIGYTENNCPCFDEKPEDWNVSLSGYYIDDPEYGIPLNAISASKECGEGSIWEMMERAKHKAIRNFLTDFTVALNATNLKSFAGYSGPIANTKNKFGTFALKNMKKYAGVRFSPKKWKGVKMTIREICVFFENSQTKEVFLYSSQDTDAPINSWIITPVGGRKTCHQLPTPEEMPFSDQDGNAIEYYFLYEVGTNRPYNAKFSCGCGVTSKPLVYSYLDGYGFTFDNLTNLQNVRQKSEYINGIQPVGEIACDSTSWLCREWDFWTDPFARVMANTIQWYAITILAGSILNSGRINFTTLNKQEHLLGRISSLRKKIGENMTYLIANIPRDASDCLQCDHSIYQKKLIEI